MPDKDRITRYTIVCERLKDYDLYEQGNASTYVWLHLPERRQASDFRRVAEKRGSEFLMLGRLP